MSLWLLLTLPALWLAACVLAVALCVTAARADRGGAVNLRVVARHTQRRPLRPYHGPRPHITRLHH